MKEINFYKETISQIKKNETALKLDYSNVSKFSVKKYITDFIKKISENHIDKNIQYSIIMPSPQQLEDRTYLIKNPVKVLINPNGNHQLICAFGTGYFSNPKSLDKNVYCKEHHCHLAAFMFAFSHLDLQPNILTGFYNRLENNFDNIKKGFLHSVCRFSINGQNKIFDGAHSLVIDEKLYTELFNFKPLSSITTNMLFQDLEILKDKNFNILEYFIEREKVLKNLEHEYSDFDDSKNK